LLPAKLRAMFAAPWTPRLSQEDIRHHVVMTGLPSGVRSVSLLRPAVATVEIVGFSAVAHASAGGDLPSTGLLLSLTALVGLVSLGLRSQLLSPRVAALVAVGAQFVLHSLFAGSDSSGAHMVMGSAAPTSREMLLAHGVSAAVTVVMLLWQDQVLVMLGRGVASGLPGSLPPLPSILTVDVSDEALGRGFLDVLAVAPRRGPPLRKFAAS
jgi:hypothetical protein